MLRLGEVEVLARSEDAGGAEDFEGEEVFVAGDEDVGSAEGGAFEEEVVFGIATDGGERGGEGNARCSFKKTGESLPVGCFGSLEFLAHDADRFILDLGACQNFIFEEATLDGFHGTPPK